MKVRAVTRPEFAAGCELAGLAVVRVKDSGAAADVIRRWAGDADVGVILVDDEIYRALSHDLVMRLDRQARPIIVPIPAPRWDERSEAEAYRLVDNIRTARVDVAPDQRFDIGQIEAPEVRAPVHHCGKLSIGNIQHQRDAL